MAIPLYRRIRDIIESARLGAARSVNTAQVVSNWLIGREIVEAGQKGQRRAGYGEKAIRSLAVRLSSVYGEGYSFANLNYFRQFFRKYPQLLIPGAGKQSASAIVHTVCEQSWKPGFLHSNLSWSHYRQLLRVNGPNKRAFYEIEIVRCGWSVRELERQINSLLYERLAVSRDKKGLMRLAVKGQEVSRPADIFKDPFVMEFVGLPESPRLVEIELEQELISNLQDFLLEMGKGFAFVARQERLTLEGDHFYIDLVFYHTVLKCFVLIELKAGKLSHQDLGQLQFYVNYFDHNRRSEGDGPTLGLILCADKNDAVVQYTLSPDQKETIFASRYKLHLPSEEELRAELRREVKAMDLGIRGREGI